MTAYANTLDGHTVDLVSIKVTKGNGLSNMVSETFDGFLFQAPEFVDIGNVTATVPVIKSGQEKAKETSKTVRVTKQIAVLGARGDYIEFELDVTLGAGTPSYAKAMSMLLVDVWDYSGVPSAIQHAIFGKFSPFPAPTQPVSKGMIVGVDKQVIEITNNVVMTASGTATDQEIRGASDSRVTAKPTGAGTDMSKIVIKIKPNSDGVFVLPRGAKLWAGISPKATRGIVAQA